MQPRVEPNETSRWRYPIFCDTKMSALNTILVPLHKLLAWRPGGYLRASGALFGWLVVRTLAQTTLFILVARALGAEGYGALISVMALAGIFSFAAMGASAVLVREGAREPHRLPRLTCDMVRLWLGYMPILCVAAVIVTELLVGHLLPTPAILAIVIAEVVCATAVDGVGRSYQSRDRVSTMGLVSSGLIVTRLAAFVIIGRIVQWTPTTWAFGYLASSAGYLLLLLLLASNSNHRRVMDSDTPLGKAIKASLPFSFSYAAQKVQAEINKPMLARISDASGAGVLSAAQRFTDLLLLPVLAMLETLALRVYRAPKPISTTFTLGLAPLATAVLGGGVLFAAAKTIPWILGPSFQASVSAVVLLAALPAVQVFRWLLSTAMTGLDLHRYFFLVHGVGAVTNVFLVAALAPAFGLSGAVWAAYLTEAVLIVIQGAILLRNNRGAKSPSRFARSMS